MMDIGLSIQKARKLKIAALEADTEWRAFHLYHPEDILQEIPKLLRCKRLWELTEKAWLRSKILLDRLLLKNKDCIDE